MIFKQAAPTLGNSTCLCTLWYILMYSTPIKLPYEIWNRHIKTTSATSLQILPGCQKTPNPLQTTARFTALPQQKVQENKR